MKLLVVGSSYVAAIRAAWKSEPRSRWPGVDVSFFGVHVRDFAQLRIDDNLVLGPPSHDRRYTNRNGETLSQHLTKVNGAKCVELGQFDHIVWVGFTDPTINEVIYRPVQQILATFDIEGLREVGASYWMPRALFTRIVEDYARLFNPPPQWRRPGMPSVTLALGPSLAETLSASADRFPALARLCTNPSGGKEAVCELVAALRRQASTNGFELLGQPESTVAPSGFTRGEFDLMNANGLGKTGKGDIFHMNAAYGALCLDQFVAITATRNVAAAATTRKEETA